MRGGADGARQGRQVRKGSHEAIGMECVSSQIPQPILPLALPPAATPPPAAAAAARTCCAAARRSPAWTAGVRG
jgi:hypothetical protein